MRSVDELVSVWVEESACVGSDGSYGGAILPSPLPGSGDLAGIHAVSESRRLRWQLTDRTLEIVEMAVGPDNSVPLKKGVGLRLFLGCEVFHPSGVSFVSRHEGHIVETCLCVATANRSLVRVFFRLNDPSQSLLFNSQRQIFQVKFCEEKGWSPVCVCRVDFDTLAFGCTNGALVLGNFWQAAGVGEEIDGSQVKIEIKIKNQNQNQNQNQKIIFHLPLFTFFFLQISYTESFLRDSSMLKRIWSTMTLGYGNTPSSIVDICHIEALSAICTVGSNGVVRLWDLRARGCVSGFELNSQQGGGPLPGGLRSVTRTLVHKYGVVIVVYLKDIETKEHGVFHVLNVAGRNSQAPLGISRAKSMQEPQGVHGNLSDFRLSDGGFLWASYVDEPDHLHATDLERYDEVIWGRQRMKAIQEKGSSSRGCSVVYTSLESEGWGACNMNEFGDSSVSFPADSPKDWIISSLFRNGLFDGRSVYDAVVLFCEAHSLDVPSTKEWGRNSDTWNQPTISRVVQNLAAEVVSEEKYDDFLCCMRQAWERRNSVLGLYSLSFFFKLLKSLRNSHCY